MNNKAAKHLNAEKYLKFLIVTVFIGYFLYSLATTIADNDLWGYLAFGRLFWETGQFPYQDIFTYVPTLPWVYHEWLTGVLFYPVYMYGGGFGLQSLKYLVGLVTFGLIYQAARVRGATSWHAGLGIIVSVGFLQIGYSPVRAQVFTYLFFTLTLYLLEKYRSTRQAGWLGLTIPLQVLWCNLHGGFLAGLGLHGCYALGETISRRPTGWLWASLSLSAAATLINPYGLDYWKYMLAAVNLSRPEIWEWWSFVKLLRSEALQGALKWNSSLFLALNIIAFMWLRRWRRWGDWAATLSLLVCLYLGWRHLRHQVFLALLLGAYSSALLPIYQGNPQVIRVLDRLGRIPTKIAGTTLAAAATILLIVLIRANPFQLVIPDAPRGNEWLAGRFYPVGAVDHLLNNQSTGNLLIDFNWGQYAIWRLNPLVKVALDGRFETVYPEAVFLPYFDFIKARENWRDFLEKYPPDYILVDVRHKIYILLKQEPGWREIYRDQGSVLLQRLE